MFRLLLLLLLPLLLPLLLLLPAPLLGAVFLVYLKHLPCLVENEYANLDLIAISGVSEFRVHSVVVLPSIQLLSCVQSLLYLSLSLSFSRSLSLSLSLSRLYLHPYSARAPGWPCPCTMWSLRIFWSNFKRSTFCSLPCRCIRSIWLVSVAVPSVCAFLARSLTSRKDISLASCCSPSATNWWCASLWRGGEGFDENRSNEFSSVRYIDHLHCMAPPWGSKSATWSGLVWFIIKYSKGEAGMLFRKVMKKNQDHGTVTGSCHTSLPWRFSSLPRRKSFPTRPIPRCSCSLALGLRPSYECCRSSQPSACSAPATARTIGHSLGEKSLFRSTGNDPLVATNAPSCLSGTATT